MWYDERRQRYGDLFLPVQSLNRCVREVLENAGAVVPKAASIDKTLKEWGHLIRQRFVAANEPLKHPPGSTDQPLLVFFAKETSTIRWNILPHPGKKSQRRQGGI
jgi:hypothetical protein